MRHASPSISAAIDRFVEDLTGLIRHEVLLTVESALGALELRGSSRAGVGTRRNAAMRPSQPSAKARKRSPEQLAQLTDALLKSIAECPGQYIGSIAEALGVTTKDLMVPIQKLISDQRITNQGKNRWTKYYVTQVKAA